MAMILIDTNVLVYAHDRGAFAKQRQAIETLHRLQLSGAGRLSAQRLAEFYVAATRGAQPILMLSLRAQQVDRLARAFSVFDITPMIVLEATRGAREHRMSDLGRADLGDRATEPDSRRPERGFQRGKQRGGVCFLTRSLLVSWWYLVTNDEEPFRAEPFPWPMPGMNSVLIDEMHLNAL